jgi:hypothetical protein
MPPRRTFTFSIPDELKEGLEAVKRSDGTPEAEQIRRGIEMWLKSKGVTPKGASRRVSPRRKA